MNKQAKLKQDQDVAKDDLTIILSYPHVYRFKPICYGMIVAAHPDDLAGVHLRRAADGDQHRRRFRQPACGRHRSDGRDDLRHRAGDLFRAAVLCAGASPFSAKGASAINRRASAARRNNRKGDHGGRLLYVFRTLARLFTSRYSPAHIAEIYLRSMPSIKSFQFPSSCSIIIASLIIMVDSI